MPVVNPVVRRPLIRPSLGLTSRLSSGRFYTNLLLQSINQNNASWANNGLTSKNRDAIAPDGIANTATTLLENGVLNNHGTSQTISPTIAAGTVVTASTWIKNGSGTRRLAIMLMLTGNSEYIFQSFNPSTGAVAGNFVVGTGRVISQGIKAYNNGWYRCWVTGIHSTAGVCNQIRFFMASDDTTVAYTGDSASNIIIWGTQLQTGYAPSNLIRTTTAQLTQEETDNVYGN